MKKIFFSLILVIFLSAPVFATATSISVPPPGSADHQVIPQPPYVYYRVLLMIGPEYLPMGDVPYTMLIDGAEYLVVIDNPNLLTLIWGLREGVYELTASAYLASEFGHFPDPTVELDVVHVAQMIFE